MKTTGPLRCPGKMKIHHWNAHRADTELLIQFRYRIYSDLVQILRTICSQYFATRVWKPAQLSIQYLEILMQHAYAYERHNIFASSTHSDVP